MLGRKRTEPARNGATLLDVIERLVHQVGELAKSVDELSARVSALEARYVGLKMGVAKSKAGGDEIVGTLQEAVLAIERHNSEVKELLLVVLDRLDRLVGAKE